MDILQTLQQKREVSRMYRHPLSSLSLNERYFYLFGLGSMAQGNIKTIKELREPFFHVMQLLDVPRTMGEEIIVDINNHFEKCFDQMYRILSMEKRISQCFLIDLMLLKQYSRWGLEYCEEVITQYCNILNINPRLIHFLEDFISERHSGNSEKAHFLVNQLEAQDMKIDYQLLNYINKDFYKTDRYSNLLLDQGGIFRIENDTIVQGDIIVENGTKLYISNADLKIGGSIKVNDAQLLIRDSYIISTEQKEKSVLLQLKNCHWIRIEGSHFNCNNHCSLLEQDSGELNMNDSTVENADKGYAILFSGDNLVMKDCQLRNCAMGGMRLEKYATGDLLSCAFVDCRAEHGGGIYVASLGPVHIRECEFYRCIGKYIGGAIYFQYRRYGQQVLGCNVQDCLPKDEPVFNAYQWMNG